MFDDYDRKQDEEDEAKKYQHWKENIKGWTVLLMS
jgi:hypothetical protein